MRLLLIEDHNKFAKFVKDGLEKEGFTVDTVDTAAGGEAAMKSVKYDTIILDLGLPDQDGLDLLRSWRENGDLVSNFPGLFRNSR